MTSSATSLPPAVAPRPVGDIDRILALPRRKVVDCEREAGTRLWVPEAQALVELMTERFSRGERLSCACQDRRVERLSGSRIVVFRNGTLRPSAPVEFEIDAFLADNAHDQKAVEAVQSLKTGQSIDLPGLGRVSCVTTLNAVQAWILRELPRAQGVFGMISVGGGKSYAGILSPLSMPCRTVVLLAKPDQRHHYRQAYLHLREHFRVPSVVFDKDFTGSYIVPGAPVLHFVPYSMLSSAKSTDLLDRLAPDMVIADECHLLSNKESSRTMRFLRYMASRREVVFAAWSGSMVNKSLKDASHLSMHALGLGSPYPSPKETDAWSAVIDPPMGLQRSDTTSPVAQMLYQVFAGRMPDDKLAGIFGGGQTLDLVRQGFRDRVIQTPGVISTVSSSVTASLTISRRKPPSMPSHLVETLATVRRENTRPDGEELVEATEVALCARTVASGYYYRWVYPKGEPEQLIDRWFAARKEWHRELRRKLRNAEPHMDSPLLCANAAERAFREPRYEGELPVWPADAWPAWADVRDQVHPESRVKFVDDYLARDAAAWALEHRGIVWVQSSAFGKKVAELAGIAYHGGGPEAEAKILAEDGSRSIVASIKAHSESRDGLQYKFSKQLVAEIPASGKGWEQLLGRLVRQGQQAETVETEVYLHVEENAVAFRKALIYAQFIEATTPNKQLLLAADIDFDTSSLPSRASWGDWNE